MSKYIFPSNIALPDFPFVTTPVKNSCFMYTAETRTESFYRLNRCQKMSFRKTKIGTEWKKKEMPPNHAEYKSN